MIWTTNKRSVRSTRSLTLVMIGRSRRSRRRTLQDMRTAIGALVVRGDKGPEQVTPETPETKQPASTDAKEYAAYQDALRQVRESMSAICGRLDAGVFVVSAGTLGILSSVVIGTAQRNFVLPGLLIGGCVLLVLTMICTLAGWIFGLLHHTRDAYALARYARRLADYTDFDQFVQAPSLWSARLVLVRQHFWGVLTSAIGLTCFGIGLALVVAFGLVNLSAGG